MVAAPAGTDRATLVTAGETAWASRGDEAQLRQAIQSWSQALQMDATDDALWVKLARAQYFLAYGHLAFDTARAEETAATYQTSISSANRALALINHDFADRMEAAAQLPDIEAALRLLDVRAVPALYWRASALGRWARSQDFTAVLRLKDEIRATMSRALELERDYFFAGPDRYFGAFFAVAPSYAGGDLARSRQHFEYSIARYPDCFSTRVLFATEYATKAQDRTLFRQQLELVIAGNPDAMPELAPENRVEQRKATEALARIEELFE